jgi:hypothetical protein
VILSDSIHGNVKRRDISGCVSSFIEYTQTLRMEACKSRKATMFREVL